MTKQRRHPTLVEVAKKAGVGPTTVSRAINGGHLVDPKTLVRIQRAIATLGYMPNQAARTLKGDRTRIVGLVIPSIADPFFSTCAEAAQAVAHTNDSLLIVLTTQNDTQAEMEAVQMLMRHRADGFLIAPADADDQGLRDLLHRVAVPVVTLDRPLAGASISSVVSDNFAGAQVATQHLIEHGYQRIACVTGETRLYTIQERVRGYCDVMRAANLECVLEDSITDYASVKSALGRLFARGKPPQAIFTLKNKVTIDTLEALEQMRLAVPRDVALLGFDDFQLAERLRPAITVVQQPIEEIGQTAAELLFQQLGIAGTGSGRVPANTPAHVQLRTHLILRRSCGCMSERTR